MKTLVQIALEEIDAFLERHTMAPTTLGKLSLNDGHVVHDLRRGGDCTISKIEKLRTFMREYERKGQPQKKASRLAASAA